jgi:hypothetical protein
MKMLPAIGITQLKNQTPDGLRVAGGASSDVAKSIVASQQAGDGEDSIKFFVSPQPGRPINRRRRHDDWDRVQQFFVLV